MAASAPSLHLLMPRGQGSASVQGSADSPYQFFLEDERCFFIVDIWIVLRILWSDIHCVYSTHGNISMLVTNQDDRVVDVDGVGVVEVVGEAEGP